MKRKKNRAFTLIELLAVVIILGVVMIIAVPSVTGYIEDSRKSTYVRSAKEYVDAVRLMIANRDISAKRTDTTYYVPIDYIKTDKSANSPYGDWVKAYVVFTYQDSVYNYYWTSVDDTGHKVDLIEISDLTKDDIKVVSSKNITITTTVGRTTKVYLLKENLKFEEIR